MERKRLIQVIGAEIGGVSDAEVESIFGGEVDAYLGSTRAQAVGELNDQDLMHEFSTFYLDYKLTERKGGK